jgi:hypothetical protein
VAGELERRWNERLAAMSNLEVEVNQLDIGTQQVLTSLDRERLMTLWTDLTITLDSPGTTAKLSGATSSATLLTIFLLASGKRDFFESIDPEPTSMWSPYPPAVALGRRAYLAPSQLLTREQEHSVAFTWLSAFLDFGPSLLGPCRGSPAWRW